MEKYFQNSNGTNYRIMDEKNTKYGRTLLLEDAGTWIVATLCPIENFGSWGQGHYFLDKMYNAVVYFHSL